MGGGVWGADLEDEQDAAVAQQALVRVVPHVARAPEDLQGLAHALPGALRAEHLPRSRDTVSTGAAVPHAFHMGAPARQGGQGQRRLGVENLALGLD